MKRKMTFFFICFVLCFTMSSCKKDETSGEESVSIESALPVENGTLGDESTAISVGKTAVTYEEYRVYKYFMESRYEKVFGTGVWQFAPEEGGNTIGQDAIEDVLRLIIRVKVINKEAVRQNITLAADEKEEADTGAASFVESLSEKVRKEKGIQMAVVSRIFEENRLAEKMYNIVTGNADTELAKKDCEAARIQYIYMEANDTNREDVKQTMSELKNRAKSGGSFYRLAKENTSSGVTESLIGLADERSRLAQAVLSMKQGEISDVIEESDGYYLVYCVEENSKKIREEYRNQIIEKRQNKAFADAYKKWADACEVRASRSLLTK